MDSVEGRLDAALTRIVRALSREHATSARDGGRLTNTGVWLLLHLEEVGPQRPGDLAAWQAVDKSTMTLQLRRLILDGLVERLPDPSDRRAALMQITDDGRAALRAYRTRGRDLLRGLLADWPAEERESLASGLSKLAASFETAADRMSVGAPGGAWSPGVPERHGR